MLVFGDAERDERTADKLADIVGGLRRAAAEPRGIARHSALVSTFMAASELVQGLADAVFEAEGRDRRTPATDAGLAWLLDLAGAVGRSWTTGFAETNIPRSTALDRLRGCELPERIRTKQAEGYAFYALYPEAFYEAALPLKGSGPFRVIGIRSVGTGLAALVASALDAPPPITVRPTGHPFQRRLAVDETLAVEIAAHREGCFAIVDEGPGFSGSSFGAVADWLEGSGVARSRIHAFPSHRGELGLQASAVHRERWAVLPRHVVDFEDLVLHQVHSARRLEAWFADLVGEAVAPLADLSGGAWRQGVYANEQDWPAANIQQERRKYRLETRDGEWLLKFAGLGAEGERKLARARLLNEAGFTPEPRAYRHGFLAERWIADARPIDPASIDREQLLDTAGRYLGCRARHFPASDARGATMRELLAMARYNTEQRLGAAVAATLQAWETRLPALDAVVRRVDSDNRMHAHEWLLRPHGTILKSDALDHSAAHDLVGCQDIAWDIVGAAVEWRLSGDEEARLAEAVERASGEPVSAELLAFYRPCYLAFQLGTALLGAQALVGCGAEVTRLNEAADRYADELLALLTRP
jgi:hypothetical protein